MIASIAGMISSTERFVKNSSLRNAEEFLIILILSLIFENLI